MTNNKNLKIAFIAALVASLLMVLTIFLPYITVKSENRELLEAMSDLTVYQEGGLTVGDFTDPSLIGMASMFSSMGQPDVASVFMVIIGIWAFLGIMAILFSLLKKATPIIVFDILAFLMFMFMRYAFTDTGVVGGEYSQYTWGIGYILYFVFAIILLAAAVWMFICKRKIKKESRILLPGNTAVQ